MKPAKQVVPLPIALAILAVGGAGLWHGVTKLNDQRPRKVEAEPPPAVAAAKPVSPR